MWWWLFPHNEGLFLIMRKWTLTPERWLDAAMLVLVVALFVQGYFPDFKTYRSGNVYGRSSFLWPCVTGVSLLAAYYPFRWAYRLLWIAIAPYAVLAIPMLGFELKQRLNVASGEERWEGNDVFEITLIHIGLVASWAIFRLITSSRVDFQRSWP